MAKKIKWFAAGYIAHSLFSGTKKEAFTPEEKERKLREYDRFLSAHPLFTVLSILFLVGLMVWYLVKVFIC